MTYQVLARKWRPRTFQELVGQEHVLKALVHALEQQRLHHAYLFTGTRGVGKTTIGRILARCLNCEEGISATPCGVCDTCREVLEGRFVDLIEIDAASRTKVEDMRELLENVQYAPTRGRFKIYLIDEVHMLSNSSFNALLKTLEEPPDHVKFLFATTDPQKLPVTILSRCLQFNLKRMTPERIVHHLQSILSEEKIPSEDDALWLLARAADGSMRDALSLTDQAIAYGDQKLVAQEVGAMLGTVDQTRIYALAHALADGDGTAVLAEVEHMSAFSPDFAAVLGEMLSLFHRVSLEQAVPGSGNKGFGDMAEVQALAKRLSAEDAQLFYQTALMGRRDLDVTPDARMGFEMTLLRMLAFRPGSAPSSPPAGGERERAKSSGDGAPSAAGETVTAEGEPVAQAKPPEPASHAKPAPQQPEAPKQPESPAPMAPEPLAVESDMPRSHLDEPVPLDIYDDAPVDKAYEASLAADDEYLSQGEPVAGHGSDAGPNDEGDGVAARDPVVSRPITSPEAPPVARAVEISRPVSLPDEGAAKTVEPKRPLPAEAPTGEFLWVRDFGSLGLNGMTRTLAANAALALDLERGEATLTLDEGHFRLLGARHQERILDALRSRFESVGKVNLVQADPGDQTPARWAAQQEADALALAVETIHADPNVQAIVNQFNGHIVEESIQAVRTTEVSAPNQ
ncbi:DNA polymerase III subunit gamma/tau [Mangrovitalea sediminis]|uniref:DNA polymerase III subunit gamma/tau n=1 Tax=Mangrovitalea sediminis TaxID=1982043 RepID=UPI000BE5B582|nr:DNA polymerase III subunit gamma/tau [Mangrovitalea sediminis]